MNLGVEKMGGGVKVGEGVTSTPGQAPRPTVAIWPRDNRRIGWMRQGETFCMSARPIVS